MFRLKVLAAAAMLVVASAEQAAIVSIGSDNIGRSVIKLDGAITTGDSAAVQAMLLTRGDLAGMRLNSQGGQIAEGPARLTR